MAWIVHALDFSMRNQLAEGVRLVARSLFNRAADIERAQQAMAAGQVGVVGPGMPAPLNYTPGTPPPYGDIGDGTTAPQFDPEQLRGLSHLLHATADEVSNFARTIDAPAPLTRHSPRRRHRRRRVRRRRSVPSLPTPKPPSASPGVLGDRQPAPQRRQRPRQARRRHDAYRDEPLASTTIDLGIVGRAAGGGAAAIATGADAAADQVPQPPVEEQQRDAEALARDYPPDKVLDDPRELQKLATELEKHEGHEAFAARFVEKFGATNLTAVPRTLQAWQNGWQIGRETSTPNQRNLFYGKPQREPTKQDIESVLYAFSGTLATATHRSPKLETELDKLANTKDPLALSWLLSDHNAHFDADFLVDAFEHGVKDVILKEASDNYLAWCDQPWNTIAERAHRMADKATAEMHQCMTEIGWIESS